MSVDNELMNVLNEYASELEFHISKLLCERNILRIIIDTIIEQDEDAMSAYYC